MSNSFFECQTVEEAKEVILGDDSGAFDGRWEKETEFTLSHFASLPCSQLPSFTILDFGCGIGRVSKAILDAYPQARVVGVDASQSMRSMAVDYVQNERFTCLSNEEFLKTDTHFDCGFACWVFQHMYDVEPWIWRISSQVDRLFVLNAYNRWLPATGDKGERQWVTDTVNIKDEVIHAFPFFQKINIPRSVGSHMGHEEFWGGLFSGVNCYDVITCEDLNKLSKPAIDAHYRAGDTPIGYFNPNRLHLWLAGNEIKGIHTTGRLIQLLFSREDKSWLTPVVSIH